jgi:two-component system sensor histidine kinase UhpB
MIASRLEEEIGRHPYLDRLRSALDESLTTIRHLSRDLGVTGLRGVPLRQALDNLLSERSNGLHTQAAYEGIEDSKLSEEQKLHIYRIVQECVTNTAKHAQARSIVLRLRYAYPNIVLRYQDDGIGFHVSRSQDDRPHLGLRSIHERARMLGGELAVSSRPGEGTGITLVMPVRDA